MIAKASERVIADPLGWEKTTNVNDPRDKTVHMKCAVSPDTLAPTFFSSPFQARDVVSHKRDVFT
jgi:hypothetical protein